MTTPPELKVRACDQIQQPSTAVQVQQPRAVSPEQLAESLIVRFPKPHQCRLPLEGETTELEDDLNWASVKHSTQAPKVLPFYPRQT